MIRALVFDFDGLILDTEGPEFQSWQDVFAQHGCNLSIEDYAHSIGTAAGAFDAAIHLERLAGCVMDRSTLKEAHRSRFYLRLEGQVILPGIEDYVRGAHRLGLKVAVASSATSDWVEGHLERFGLRNWIHGVRCFGDGLRAKPEPDLFLAAVEAVGVQPSEAVAFEDSPNGVLAAKRAGLHCVAVPNDVTRLLPLGHADLQLASLAEMPLESLLAHFNAR